MTHKHALITGGAGFVGSSLCVALREHLAGLDVTAFDNLRRRGSEQNLARLQSAGVRFVHGDVRALADLTSIRPTPDLLIECSAEPSAQAGYGGSPEYLVETNLTGCFHCLELARATQADFLFLSTSRVYPFGSLNALPFEERETRFVWTGKTADGVSEQFPLDGPRSLYGMTKLAAEWMIEEYANAYGFRFIIDRFGLLTGPRQMAKSDQGVFALWMAAHVYQRPLAYIGFGGSGKQVRDCLHIDDACDLLIDQIEHFDLYQGRRFNAGGGPAHSLSLLEATELCRELSGHTVPVGREPETRPADLRIYLTDHRAVSAVRSWRPRRDVRTALDDIRRWLETDPGDLEAILFGR